jgi:hypothetical protein
VSNSEREVLYQAIEVLLGDGTIQTRLSGANECLNRLEFRFSNDFTDIRHELTKIIHDIAEINENVSSNGSAAYKIETNLSEKLLSVYMMMSGGIFIV